MVYASVSSSVWGSVRDPTDVYSDTSEITVSRRPFKWGMIMYPRYLYFDLQENFNVKSGAFKINTDPMKIRLVAFKLFTTLTNSIM